VVIQQPAVGPAHTVPRASGQGSALALSENDDNDDYNDDDDKERSAVMWTRVGHSIEDAGQGGQHLMNHMTDAKRSR